MVLHHKYKTVLYHITHYQVEEGGQDDSGLSSSHSFFEVRAVVLILAGYNLLLLPKHYQEPSYVGDGAVSLKSLQEAAMFYSVVCLLKV